MQRNQRRRIHVHYLLSNPSTTVRSPLIEPKMLNKKIVGMLVDWETESAVNLGSESIPSLMKALKNQSGVLHGNAVISLVKIGRRAVPFLLEALNEEDKYVREDAIRVLGEIKDARAIPVLIEILKSNDTSFRALAAEALSEIGLHRLKMIEDKVLALLILGRTNEIHAMGTQAVPTLIEALKDFDTDVRTNAVRVLGRIGDVRAIPALIEALNDTRIASAVSIEGGLVALILGLKNFDANARLRAEEALEKIKAAPTIPTLVKLLEDSNGNVRVHATRMLKNILMADPDGFGREVVRLVNGNFGDELRATDQRTVAAFRTLEQLMRECGGKLDEAA